MKAYFVPCLLWLLVMSVSSESQAPLPANPIKIEASGVGSDTPDVSLKVTNLSGKEIDGFVLVAEFSDSTGQRVSTLVQTRLYSFGPGVGKSMAPGETREHKVQVPVGSNGPVKSRFLIDHVLFKDGSVWGPDTYKNSIKLQGQRTGALVERARLRHLLKNRGADALVQDLNATP